MRPSSSPGKPSTFASLTVLVQRYLSSGFFVPLRGSESGRLVGLDDLCPQVEALIAPKHSALLASLNEEFGSGEFKFNASRWMVLSVFRESFVYTTVSSFRVADYEYVPGRKVSMTSDFRSKTRGRKSRSNSRNISSRVSQRCKCMGSK